MNRLKGVSKLKGIIKKFVEEEIMEDWRPDKKTFSEKIDCFVKKQWDNPNTSNARLLDVFFAVGPEKEIIKSSKFVLVVATQVFEKNFREVWAQNGEADPIHLPEIDPAAFKIFLQIIHLDDAVVPLTLDALKPTNEDVFNLIPICKEFGASQTIMKKLQDLANKFFQTLPHIVEKEEFSGLSKNILEGILQQEGLPVEEIALFQGVCSWAEFRCKQINLETSGANIRQLLGNLINYIRFPTMTIHEFTKIVVPKNVLQAEEKLRLFEYIGLPEAERTEEQAEDLGYNSKKRTNNCTNPIMTTVVFIKPAEVEIDPHIPLAYCQDWKRRWHSIYVRVSQDIEIHSVGFLGPIEADATFEASLKITSKIEPDQRIPYMYDKCTKSIMAIKGQMFHLVLDKPIQLRANLDSGPCYNIAFALKGDELTQSCKADDSKHFEVSAGGVDFYCEWSTGKFAELGFKKAVLPLPPLIHDTDKYIYDFFDYPQEQ